MSEVAKAFGKERTSPSEVNTFASERGFWLARYVRKIKDDVGPAAWRGDAVEAGLQAALYGRDDPLTHALNAFELREQEYAKAHDGEVHPDADAERAAIEPCLNNALLCVKAHEIGQPTATQLKVEAYLPGCELPMHGYLDFAFADHAMDCKATNKIPSDAKPEHAAQVSFYAYGRKESKARLLYASTAQKTKNPYNLVTLGSADIQRNIENMARVQRNMETLMRAAISFARDELITPQRALTELCRPDFSAMGGGFYKIWKPEMIERAREIEEWRLA
ncbi:MAG: hypothetical protein AB7J28_16790 [Hyphomonadaceae bacterium]